MALFGNNWKEDSEKEGVSIFSHWKEEKGVENIPHETTPKIDVNFLLVNALRHLSNEDLKLLAESILERIPKQ